LLEDVHDVAVQRQHPENPVKLQRVLLACFKTGLVASGKQTDAIGATIHARSNHIAALQNMAGSVQQIFMGTAMGGYARSKCRA
jgi:hypothetical protein